MQSITITSRPPSRIKKWNQFSQFRWTSIKAIQGDKKNATHVIIHKSLINCDNALIFQVFKVDLLYERLKPSVCQNGLVNSRKSFLCRNLLWDQILLCSTKMLLPKVPMLPLFWQTFNAGGPKNLGNMGQSGMLMLKAKESLILDSLRVQGYRRILMPSETPTVRVWENHCDIVAKSLASIVNP